MERNEISLHEAKVYMALAKHQSAWKTSAELSAETGIASRTARSHCLRFSRIGIVDTAEVFPAHRYKLAEKADKRAGGYLQRLKRACDIFALKV